MQEIRDKEVDNLPLDGQDDIEEDKEEGNLIR
jgi:hypothetical protein